MCTLNTLVNEFYTCYACLHFASVVLHAHVSWCAPLALLLCRIAAVRFHSWIVRQFSLLRMSVDGKRALGSFVLVGAVTLPLRLPTLCLIVPTLTPLWICVLSISCAKKFHLLVISWTKVDFITVLLVTHADWKQVSLDKISHPFSASVFNIKRDSIVQSFVNQP